jgi:hypothetical protein
MPRRPRTGDAQRRNTGCTSPGKECYQAFPYLQDVIGLRPQPFGDSVPVHGSRDQVLQKSADPACLVKDSAVPRRFPSFVDGRGTHPPPESSPIVYRWNSGSRDGLKAGPGCQTRPDRSFAAPCRFEALTWVDICQYCGHVHHPKLPGEVLDIVRASRLPARGTSHRHDHNLFDGNSHWRSSDEFVNQLDVLTNVHEQHGGPTYVGGSGRERSKGRSV